METDFGSANQERLAAAYHEAGHLIACWDFGIKAWAYISNTGTGWVGRCNYADMTPFQNATVAWAGPIAQEACPELDLLENVDSLVLMTSTALRHRPEYKGDFSTLQSLSCLNKIRPIHEAIRILSARREDLIAAAKTLYCERSLISRGLIIEGQGSYAPPR